MLAPSSGSSRPLFHPDTVLLIRSTILATIAMVVPFGGGANRMVDSSEIEISTPASL